MEDLLRAALTNALGAAVLATAVAGLALILARRPAVVHVLWVVVLLKLVTPPLFEVPVGRLDGAAGPADPPIAAAVDADGPEAGWTEVVIDLDDLDDLAALDEDAAAWDVEAGEVEALAEPAPFAFSAVTGAEWAALAWRGLGGVWIAGSLATAVLAAVRIARFRRALRDAEPAGLHVEEEVAELSAAMGLKRPPLVDLIDARTTPMLWGGLGFRPRLILPRMLWKELDARRRTLLLTHELAHLRRGDHRIRLLELAVTVLYWWLPVVWWVRRALRDVEEQCCDAWVVWMFPDDARAYAETLLDTVDFLNPGADPEPLLASGFGKVQHLRKRLTMVMKGSTPRTAGWQGSLGALALAGVLLPMSPTWAQKTDAAPISFEAVADEVVFAGDPDDPAGVTIVRGGVAAVDGRGATTLFRAVAEGDDVKTIDFNGPTTVSRLPGDVVFASVLGDEEKDEADRDKDKADRDKDRADRAKDEADRAKDEADRARDEAEKVKEKAEKVKEKAQEEAARVYQKAKEKIRRELHFEARGVGESPDAAIQKAVEELKSQLKALEDKKAEGPEAEAGKKALESALEQLKKLAERPGAITITGRPGEFRGAGQAFTFKPEKLQVEPLHVDGKPNVRVEAPRVVVHRRRPDGPEAAEARKQVDELRRVLAEKQREMHEASRKLAEASRKLAEVQGDVVVERVVPDVAKLVEEARARRDGDRADSRIDSLEQKLNKVLEELEGLKKPKDQAEAEGEGDEKK